MRQPRTKNERITIRVPPELRERWEAPTAALRLPLSMDTPLGYGEVRHPPRRSSGKRRVERQQQRYRSMFGAGANA
jgi:hypothetical protein